MSYLRDRVMVLKKDPFREHDRRYVMYGAEFGLLTAVARGASVASSKQAGHLEPFTESDVMIAKGSAFDKLAVAKRVCAASRTPYSLSGIAVCGAFCDLVVQLVRPGVSDVRIFSLLQEFVQTASVIPDDVSADRVRLFLCAGTLQLLDHLGFGPPLPAPSQPGTTPVPSLALLAFMRRSALVDSLRVTAPSDVFRHASVFVEEALKQTPLDQEPRAWKSLRAFVS